MAESDAGTLDHRLGGIPAFYGAIWSESRAAATRWHVAIVVEIAMVVAWFAIRSTAGVDGRVYLAWVIAAGALALVAPLSGLVVFVASSVFYEPDPLPRALALREVVLIPLALGVLIRIAADRFRWRPSLAVWLALLLLAGTALGLLNSFERFPDETAWRAARSWFNNMAGPVILLVAAVWTARGGSMRVLTVACLVAVVSATTALVEYASPGLLSGGRFEWVGFWKDYGPRLAGTIPSPNALSAQLIVPTAVLAAAVLLARDLRLKALALVGLVPLVIAHYLTFSRAPLLGAYVFAVVVAWRFRRWLGIVVLVAGVAAAAIVLPRYLEFRAEAVGGAGDVPKGTVLTASDQYRFVPGVRRSGCGARLPSPDRDTSPTRRWRPTSATDFFGSPHNEWLRLFAEEGTVVGLVGIAFVLATAWSLARIPGWLGTGLLGGFLAYVVAASFNNPFLFIRVSAVAFPMFGVGLALAARARAPAVVDATVNNAIAEPIVTTEQPTETAVEPTENAEPTGPAADATTSDAIAEPIKTVAEPAEAAVEPTETDVEPTETAAEPLDPTADPPL